MCPGAISDLQQQQQQQQPHALGGMIIYNPEGLVWLTGRMQCFDGTHTHTQASANMAWYSRLFVANCFRDTCICVQFNRDTNH